ncbi:hypothetical protein RCL1_002115 [Eukaryota sp. TZLM3-RCL]
MLTPLDQYLLAPLTFLTKNPHDFFKVCGGAVQFLSETCGSELSLSNNNHWVEKTKRLGNFCKHSFVAINHDYNGVIILTLRSKGEYGHFYSSIGFFDPIGCLSNDYRSFTGVQITWCASSFVLRQSGKEEYHTDKIMEVDDMLIISFQDHYVTFALPSQDWSKTVPCEENGILGIHLSLIDECWSIDN